MGVGFQLHLGRVGSLRLGGGDRAAFGYDAVERQGSRGRRPKAAVSPEGAVLPDKKRRKLVNTVHELQRNSPTAAWMCRFHSAAVAQHTFQADTGDDVRDREIEAYIANAGRAGNFDCTGRHSADQGFVLAEQNALFDGDVLLHFLEDGRVQFIEGDRIADPPPDRQAAGQVWEQGILLDDLLCPLAFSINNRRKGGAREFVSTVSADDCHLHGFFHRFDQVRGITPLAAALNHAADLYEATEYALQKAKITQLIGLAIERKSGGTGGGGGFGAARSDSDGGGEGEPETRSIDFSKGFQLLDLDEDETARFLHVDTPGTSFLEFNRRTTQEVLRALDLDMAFFDSNHTNWSGHHMARNHWRRTARMRQEACGRMRMAWSDFVLNTPAARRSLNVGEGERIKSRWLPIGLAGWTDPRKEIAAQRDAVAGDFTSPQRVCAEQGLDLADVIREKALAQQMRLDAGLVPDAAAGSIDAAIAAAITAAVSAAAQSAFAEAADGSQNEDR